MQKEYVITINLETGRYVDTFIGVFLVTIDEEGMLVEADLKILSMLSHYGTLINVDLDYVSDPKHNQMLDSVKDLGIRQIIDILKHKN